MPIKIIAATSLAALLSSTSAFALEGKALFEDMTAKGKTKVAYESIEENGASFVMKGLTITPESGETQTAETFTVDNLREEGTTVVLDRAVLTGFSRTDEIGAGPNKGKTRTIQMGEMSIAGMSAPRAIFGGDVKSVMDQRVKVGSVSVTDYSGDQDGDGQMDTTIASMGATEIDTPLDWRLTEEMKAEATGPAAEPMTAGGITMGEMKVESPAGTFTFAGLDTGPLRVPTSMEASPADWATAYKSLKFGAMTLEQAGKKVFGIDSMTADIERAEGTNITSSSEIAGFFVDLTAIPDPRTQAIAQQLGYSTITGRMSGKGAYDFATGLVDVQDVKMDLDDVAELTFSYKMSGYTPELASKINALSAKAGAAGGNPAEMLALIGQLNLDSAKIELKDDSITKKLLDFQAAQMKTTGEQLAQGAPMFVGMGMAQLNTPEFTQQVAAAVGSFLQKPGTLTVTAQPAAPVSFAEIAVAAQSAPKAVIEMLNVGVAASE